MIRRRGRPSVAEATARRELKSELATANKAASSSVAERSWHVWVGSGDVAASADFMATHRTAALEKASALWGVPTHDLRAHPVTDCAARGCGG